MHFNWTLTPYAVSLVVLAAFALIRWMGFV